MRADTKLPTEMRGLYREKPIEAMSREELMDALVEMGELLASEYNEHRRQRRLLTPPR